MSIAKQRIELLISALRGEYPWRNVPLEAESVKHEIQIKPLDLVPMLKQYLAGSIHEQDLQEWASWVLIQDEFCTECCENDVLADDLADYYEPMWYVLQQLSTPFIDGAITRSGVKGHIATLMVVSLFTSSPNVAMDAEITSKK